MRRVRDDYEDERTALHQRIAELEAQLAAWEDVPDEAWGVYDNGDNGLIGPIDESSTDFIDVNLPDGWRIQRRTQGATNANVE